MAKIFWIAEKSGDYMEIFGFNNKRKAQEKAMELAPHFSYGDNEVPKEKGNDEGYEWLYSGQIDAGACFILGRADGMPDVKGFNSVADAKAYAEKGATGACFPVKLKGGMGSVYMSSETEGDGRELFAFEDGELDREVKTGPAKDGKKEPIAINSLEGRLKILAPAKYKFKYPIQLYVNHTKMDYPHRDRSEFKDDIVVADPNKSMKWFLKSYSKKEVYPEFYKADMRIDLRGGYGLVPSMIVVSGTKDGLAYMLYMEYYGGHAYQSGKGGESIDGAWPKIMNDWPVLKGADINKFREDWMGESKTILESFKYVPTFESFIGGSQKVNENFTLLDSFDEYGWSDEYDGKYFPITNALNGLMDDLVWITDNFPDFIQDEGKLVKKYAMDGLDSPKDYDDEEVEDPHGDVDFSLYKYKGLKIGWFTDEYGYSAGLCHERDVKKWTKIIKDMGEEEYLDVF